MYEGILSSRDGSLSSPGGSCFFFRPHAINDRPVGLVFPNRSEGSTEVVEIQEGPRIEEGVMSSPGAAGLGGSP